MKKTYFMTIKLTTEEWVDIIYESASRKNTFNHRLDLFNAVRNDEELNEKFDWNYRYNKMPEEFAYIMNDKNKYDQCFGEHRIIDLR